MYELHARTRRKRRLDRDRDIRNIAAAASQARSRKRTAEQKRGGRPPARQAGRQRNRRCRGSGCLWQTPFLHAASSLSLPLSPSLSPFSPISLDSREMVIALSHVATLHCTAAASLPSPGLRPPFVDSFFARICAQAIDSDARFSSDAGMTSSRR